MKNVVLAIVILTCVNCTALFGIERQHKSRIQSVASADGLVAFWDFEYAKENTWISYYDRDTVDRSFPLFLRRIGDEETYSTDEWPYSDSDSRMVFDRSGPFGSAVRFNRGYIYGAVQRESFTGTLLDLHGKRPFTMIAWVKFTGRRHMVAGIWDEGGWDRYAGRRQVALFAGLFGRKGVIAHISATGAASYPQSTIKGAQYARLRAIDGQPFKDNEWAAMAMTYDPERSEVIAYLNGEMTQLKLTDPVAQDVYEYPRRQPANPFRFELPVYSPRSFALKFNGYDLKKDGVSEHRLHVDLAGRSLTYRQDGPTAQNSKATYRILFDVERQGVSILGQSVIMKATDRQEVMIPPDTEVKTNDEVWARLEVLRRGRWKQIGSQLRYRVQEGAPFTFGRALGLGSEDLKHGSQLCLDGVAVFNRVLGGDELKKLSFTRLNNSPPGK